MSATDDELGQLLAGAIEEATKYGRAGEVIVVAQTTALTLMSQINHIAELHPTLMPELKAASDAVMTVSAALTSALGVANAQYENVVEKLTSAGEKSA